MAQRRTRRRFTREYKAQAVQRVIESGLPLADIAAELDVSPGQLSQWRNEQLAAGSAEALAQKKADEAEMLRLKREVKRLEDENLILRKAAALAALGQLLAPDEREKGAHGPMAVPQPSCQEFLDGLALRLQAQPRAPLPVRADAQI